MKEDYENIFMEGAPGEYAGKSYWVSTADWSEPAGNTQGVEFPYSEELYDKRGRFNCYNAFPSFAVIGKGNKVFYNNAGYSQSSVRNSIKAAIDSFDNPDIVETINPIDDISMGIGDILDIDISNLFSVGNGTPITVTVHENTNEGIANVVINGGNLHIVSTAGGIAEITLWGTAGSEHNKDVFNIEIEDPSNVLIFSEDFEDEPQEWAYRNGLLSWRHGDADELAADYMMFEEPVNGKFFMGINSFGDGGSGYQSEGACDTLISPVLNLSSITNLSVVFDMCYHHGYIGNYAEFEFAYRTSQNSDWVRIKEYGAMTQESWVEDYVAIPVEAQTQTTQFAFIYNNKHISVAGAGIDNFKLYGSWPSGTVVVYNAVEDMATGLGYSTNLDLSELFWISTGETIELSIESNSNPNSITDLSLNGSILNIIASDTPGSSEITIKGSVGNSSCYDTFLITVEDFDVVKVPKPLGDFYVKTDTTRSINIENLFLVQSGNNIDLSIEANSNSDIATANIDDNNLVFSSLDNIGSTSIIIKGESGDYFALDTIIVNVKDFDSNIIFFEDFEEEPSVFTYSNDVTGWQWGTKQTLPSSSCWGYNVPTEGVSFMGVNSDITSSSVSVKDHMLLPPLYLLDSEGFDNILSISYDVCYWIFDNEFFKLKYRLSKNSAWVTIKKYPIKRQREWTNEEYIIPNEAKSSATQFAFEYNDRNGPGYGAGIDNLKIFIKEVSIKDTKNIAEKYELEQNYPNPFNPETTISFTVNGISDLSKIKLSVFNVKGELVCDLIEGSFKNGKYSAKFNASNLNSGVYFYTLKVGEYSYSKKMIMIK